MAVAEPRHTLKAGATKVLVEPWSRGISIVHNGVAVTVGSNMVVTKPPWTPHYYLGPSDDVLNATQVEELSGGQQIVLRHKGERDTFTGTDTISVYDDGRVERHLMGSFNEPEEKALIQWQIAAINPVLIVGRTYHATLRDGAECSGTVPVEPVSTDDAENTLARDFTEISFDSRIGPIRISVESQRALTCYDYRKSRWADPARPFFWFGDLGTRFKQGDPIEYRITVHLPKMESAVQQARSLSNSAEPLPAANAQTIATGEKPILIPKPKKISWLDGELMLPAGQSLEEAVEQVELKQFEGSPEAYMLAVHEAGIKASAGSPAGYRHALRTLKQLASTNAVGETVVPYVHILDQPSLEFRGVHFFTGGKGVDLHLKLIQNIIADLKLNHIVLESEYIEWDAYPELHHPDYGMPKSEVRQILKLCADEGIEVIPLVMSLGHCQWMFETTDKFLDLAEDPVAKWAYCVTNPATYDFIYTIYEEAIELFKPKFFHIGHDEYADRGRVPFRESSQPYTVEQLFMLDTLRHHEWFKQRGIRLMMWGDMLLADSEAPDATNAKSEAEAHELRDELPDDIVIADWHYVETQPEKYTSLKVFQDEGHDALASAWYRPGNIINYAKAAADQKSFGYLQTTWAGYSLDEDSFQREMHQYVAWVTAAEAAWNADRPPNPDTFLAGEHFLRLMGMTSLKPANRAGWLLDLEPLSNEPLSAKDAEGWFGFGPQYDLSSLPTGRQRLRGVEFLVPPQATVLSSKLTRGETYPSQVEVVVDAKSRTLVFLHATNFTCRAGATVGSYEIERANGSLAVIPLVYGKHILAVDDLTPAAEAPVLWHGQTKAGRPVGVRGLLWENDQPDVPIHAIRARSQNAAGALMWLSVTGLNDAAESGE